MNKRYFNYLIISGLITLIACNKPVPIEKVIDDALSLSVKQYTLMAEVMKENPGLLPRTLDTTGALVTAKSNWWTSGFVPGSLWYLYEYSGDDPTIPKEMLLIDPDECIDCNACVPECPWEAIFEEEMVPSTLLRIKIRCS